MIERDSRNFLTVDSQAALAIRGMGPSTLATKLELMEKQYQLWLGVEVNDDGHVVKTSWYTRPCRMILNAWFLREPFKVFRWEIIELVAAAEKLRTDKQAADIQAQFYQQYLKMAEQERETHKFLEEHFPHDLREAQVKNTPLAQVVREILFRQVPKGSVR